MNNNTSLEKILIDLKERAKELNCLYKIQELLSNSEEKIDDVCDGIINAIPPGWQYPEVCCAKITLGEKEFYSTKFKDTDWVLCTTIEIRSETIGKLCVVYTEERPEADEGPFLKEERKLVETIADQLGNYILHQQLKTVFEQQKYKPDQKKEWDIILDMLKGTDPNLLIRISRKMVNFLCWSGIKEADKLLELFSPEYKDVEELLKDANRPYQRQNDTDPLMLSYEIFKVAEKHIGEKEIINKIQEWIKEDRSGFMVDILEDTGSSLSEINNAIERYHHLMPHGLELSQSRKISFRVALIRRLLSDQSQFIDIAKQFITVDEFADLLHRVIYPAGSHGKLGGKSSGLFLAKIILKRASESDPLLRNIKTPKSWYLTSDCIIKFMKQNNLEDVMSQKYKEVGQVRQEYPYIVQVFKNSLFSPEIIQGLSIALEDFGKKPLIVRSSSLLEDRLGAAFAGKYKSLFIANQGTKEKRLMELIDAISEVYASTFGPDPIEYRAEQNLLDYHEEMGIIIQEVVGQRVGDYFLPAFGGVAFSHNEFRWSSRIRREDGLVRLVPGLGTRAVDRLSNDYPILIAPGQPGLRVNVTIDEIIRYSPKQIDLINLKTGSFETVDISELINECGSKFPFINKIVSILNEDSIQQPRAIGVDYSKKNFVVTFEGLITNTPFLKQMHLILKTLAEKYRNPVDIEFAHDGKDFYLLQCRGQSFGYESKPASIPKGIPDEQIIFSANRYISNGIVPDITHLVYVSPQKYSEITEYKNLIAIGRAVGRLNKLLPKRQFILMGPGRWGSRGDIKLGVSVTYSEINNTAMLIEIARKQKDYVPDLSFGTHFFQDLVEANIRYLPLYPDDKGILFNEEFLNSSENIFSAMLPDLNHLSDVIKVIDIASSTDGKIMQVFMNAETEDALGVLTEPSMETFSEPEKKTEKAIVKKENEHWRWRQENIEGLASKLDPKRFGVKRLYLFGSTKNATAGPASDIDVLIHFSGTERQRHDLNLWLEGWSQSLSNINFLRTGYKTNGLLDVHIITDKDIEKRTSYAVKIGAVTDAARPLPIGKNNTKS